MYVVHVLLHRIHVQFNFKSFSSQSILLAKYFKAYDDFDFWFNKDIYKKNIYTQVKY